MKLFTLLILLFTTNVYADFFYHCQHGYSLSPCPIPMRAILPPSSGNAIKIIRGKVIKVADGDTITVDTFMSKEKIRFAQIDAPEISHFGSDAQPYGKEAEIYLHQRLLNQNVQVEVEAVDQYGRNVGTVFLGNTNINREMVQNGYAWVYRQYAHDPALIELENMARARHIGLWSLSNPIYPAYFRKENK